MSAQEDTIKFMRLIDTYGYGIGLYRNTKTHTNQYLLEAQTAKGMVPVEILVPDQIVKRLFGTGFIILSPYTQGYAAVFSERTNINTIRLRYEHQKAVELLDKIVNSRMNWKQIKEEAANLLESLREPEGRVHYVRA